MIEWGGRKWVPGKPQPRKPINDIEELLKPLGEKTRMGNVWGSQIMNVEKPVTSQGPPPSPTPTPSVTPTNTVTPTTTNTPTPSITPTLTTTPTQTPTPSSTPIPPLFLDTWTGATAAYSIRKLSNNYSGPAIRIRHNGTNAETDIGFSGNNLDTAAIVSAIGASEAMVVVWYDQTGNGFHVRNTTAVAQPNIYIGSTIGMQQINNIPAIRFNAVVGANTQALVSTGFTGNINDGDITLIEVSRKNAGNASNYDLAVMTGDYTQNATRNGGVPALQFLASGQDYGVHNVWVAAPPNYYVDPTPHDIPHIGAYTRTGGTSGNTGSVTINWKSSGETLSSGYTQSFNSEDGSQKITIGSQGSTAVYSYGGRIQEVIVYPFDQQSNLTSIYGDINAYYGYL